VLAAAKVPSQSYVRQPRELAGTGRSWRVSLAFGLLLLRLPCGRLVAFRTVLPRSLVVLAKSLFNVFLMLGERVSGESRICTPVPRVGDNFAAEGESVICLSWRRAGMSMAGTLLGNDGRLFAAAAHRGRTAKALVRARTGKEPATNRERSAGTAGGQLVRLGGNRSSLGRGARGEPLASLRTLSHRFGYGASVFPQLLQV
jgi:hypothetical protein